MKIEQGVRRYDLGELRKAMRTPQGFLMAPGFATRTGVFPYRSADGTMRYELRHPDDVMDPVSLDTLRHAPFTLEHPPEMITPKNVQLYRKGHVTDRVEVNRDLVEVDVIIQDHDAISAVENGLRELSSGYTADIVEEHGVWNGTPYNFRQKNIRYNHLAGVTRGRAGPEVRLRLDSADAVMEAPAAGMFGEETSVDAADSIQGFGSVTPGVPGPETKKVVISGREVDLPSELADTVQDMLDRYDEIRAKQFQLEEQMSKQQKRADVDVNQPGISPQVKVEQQTPDGRSSSGKAGPGDKSGVSAAKGDEEEEKKEDAEGEENQDGENPFAKKMDDMQKKMDAMQGKIDAAAAASMNKGEAKPKFDSADVQKQIRARVSLERTAEKLVPAETANKFDSMSDDEIRSAVVKHRQPGANLKDKSSAYIESRFDSVVEMVAEQGGESLRKNAGRAMLGIVEGSGERNDSASETQPDPAQARLKMIQASRELHKSNLSASKK